MFVCSIESGDYILLYTCALLFHSKCINFLLTGGSTKVQIPTTMHRTGCFLESTGTGAIQASQTSIECGTLTGGVFYICITCRLVCSDVMKNRTFSTP